MSDRIFVHYGHSSFDPVLWHPIKNRTHSAVLKPTGGLWASPADASYGWRQWCEDNDYVTYSDGNCFSFRLKACARVLVIDSVEVLTGLPHVGGKSPTYGLLDDLHEVLMSAWDGKSLDFEAIASDFDAIEYVLSADPGLYWALYGWDCDCIVVLDSTVIEVCDEDR